MQLINYITFKNNDDFVKWQNESKRKIHNVSPMMMEIDLGIKGTEKDGEADIGGNAKTTVGVFVTYITSGDELDAKFVSP